MKRISFLLVALILAGNVWAADSQTPTPCPSKAGQEPHYQTNNCSKVSANNGSPADNSAPPINLTVSPNTYVEAANKPENEEDKSSGYEGWLTIFTGLLVVIGFLQFNAMREQAKSIKVSVDIAGQAADAAVLQAKTAVAVDSPFPRIADIKLVEYVDKTTVNPVSDRVLPGAIPKFCRVLICVSNIGRTPMKVTEFCIEHEVTDKLPITPIYRHLQRWDMVLGQNEQIWMRSDPACEIQLAESERGNIDNGQGHLWVFGYFSYSNFIGETFTKGFSGVWDSKVGLTPVDIPNYRYEKKTT